MWRVLRRVALAFLLGLLSAFPTIVSATGSNGRYIIGVYYFPGWRSGLTGAPALEPWERIKSYPERKPLLGWYDDGDVSIVNAQLGWMHNYGIGYVVFDWYWDGSNTFLDHSLNAYFRADNRASMPFAIMWANHDASPRSRREFTLMVRFWIAKYLARPEYLRVDGHPVVFIFDRLGLAKKAQAFGSSDTELIAEAQDMARQAGIPDIHFVSSTYNDPAGSSTAYAGMSTYNYHGLKRESESYDELDRAYRDIWAYVGKREGAKYIVPMTQGWDRRPWGGSANPAHDNSASTPAAFEAHIRAAKEQMDKIQSPGDRYGVICCWNEFGEGSYIEPTEYWGFRYLEAVRRVFSGAQ